MVSYARGDIGPSFAATYRLPLPKDAPFAIGYTFEGKPHDYLPDVVRNPAISACGTLTRSETPLIRDPGRLVDKLVGGPLCDVFGI